MHNSESKVRDLCKIGFADPDGASESYPGLTQMVLADVKLSGPPSNIAPGFLPTGFAGEGSLFFIMPMPSRWFP